MTSKSCQVIAFPKKPLPQMQQAYIEITFDEVNFLMPLFINLCNHYGISCEVEMINDNEALVYIDTNTCSLDHYESFLWPRFEYAGGRLHDYSKEAYTRLINDIPMIMDEIGERE